MSASERECEYYIETLDVPDEVEVEEDFSIDVQVCCRGCQADCPEASYTLEIQELVTGPGNNYDFPVANRALSSVQDRSSTLRARTVQLVGGTCTTENVGFQPLAVDEPGIHKVIATAEYNGKTVTQTSKVKVVDSQSSSESTTSQFN